MRTKSYEAPAPLVAYSFYLFTMVCDEKMPCARRRSPLFCWISMHFTQHDDHLSGGSLKHLDRCTALSQCSHRWFSLSSLSADLRLQRESDYTTSPGRSAEKKGTEAGPFAVCYVLLFGRCVCRPVRELPLRKGHTRTCFSHICTVWPFFHRQKIAHNRLIYLNFEPCEKLVEFLAFLCDAPSCRSPSEQVRLWTS